MTSRSVPATSSFARRSTLPGPNLGWLILSPAEYAPGFVEFGLGNGNWLCRGIGVVAGTGTLVEAAKVFAGRCGVAGVLAGLAARCGGAGGAAAFAADVASSAWARRSTLRMRT